MPDIGRWGVVDQLAEKYYSFSTYNYVLNSPNIAIDPDGRDIIFIFYDDKNKQQQYQFKGGNFYRMQANKKGELVATNEKYKKGTNEGLDRYSKALNKLWNSGDKTIRNQLSTLANSDNKHYIVNRKNVEDYAVVNPYGEGVNLNKPEPTSSIIYWDKDSYTSNETIDGYSDAYLMSHETQHQFDLDQGLYMYPDPFKGTSKSIAEIRGVANENRYRNSQGKPSIYKYGDGVVNKKSLEIERKKNRTASYTKS